MSTTTVLCLMAGGYPDTAVQKHLLSIDGSYLFERTISAIPTRDVWIIHNQNTMGFWNGWYARTAPVTFPDKTFSFFLDKQSRLGDISNPSLWMTSGVPSLAMNFEKEAIVYSAIDTYFQNYNFVEELMQKKLVWTIAQEKGNDIWQFADMMKVSTESLLVNGQLPKGRMKDVAEMMHSKGMEFEMIKVKGDFANCGTPHGLFKAESSYSVEAKVLS